MAGRTISIRIVLFTIIVLIGSSALGQTDQQSPDAGRKQMRATRIANGSIDVNGRLDESVWQQAAYVSDFLQVLPIEFGKPEDSTRVAILYDDDAVYIGARMFIKDPDNLRMDLSRRDDRGLGEQIIISLDTYHDRRTAYGFGVTTAGVRFDRYTSTDSENWDFSWDAVWEVKTDVGQDSWTAEFRIPFSQLRFNNTDVQVWGINLNRWRPYTTEDIFWVVVPPSETGFVSRFGDLIGIEGVKPSRRLELMPYVASDGRFTSNYDPADPYNDGSVFDARFGGDLKMGLGPNLTLDATFNPDFGQVEADPAVVNLSAYETFYSEKRPFFTEGSDLFLAIGPRWFYSRRIGARPFGRGQGDFNDNPDNTAILGAAKITGRLKSRTSIGALLAVTDSEYATEYYTATDSESKVKVEPMATRGVVRVKQEFGAGGSTAGMILTGLTRSMNDDDPLAMYLTKEAYSGAIDWSLKFDDRNYNVDGQIGFSHVTGTKEAILLKQLAPAHYYQRPDASHVTLDSSRTSLSGYSAGMEIEKAGGEHWHWFSGFSFESPGFELNDAGLISAVDDIDGWAGIRYRETRPGNHFRNYSFELEGWSSSNFGGIRQESGIELDIQGQWLNYWSTSASFGVDFGGLSDNMTRGGPLAGSLDGWNGSVYVSNNYNSVTTYYLNGWYARNELGGWGYNISGRLATRIGDRIRLSITPEYSETDSRRQFIGSGFNPDSSETYYTFSSLKQSALSMEIRASYFFSPDLSLELYSQPFAASGHFYDYGTLHAPRSKELDPFDYVDGPYPYSAFSPWDDFGDRSFRSSMVLRWEFSPGSTAYFVWQRSMEDEVDPGQNVKVGSLWDGFSGDGLDIFAIKISYWIPVS